MSRFYTVLFGGPGARFNAGRVQTPTVNLIVRRQHLIEHFVSEPYFTVTAHLGAFKAYARARDQTAAAGIVARCAGGEAVVLQTEREEKAERPPKLYDLTVLQRDANWKCTYTSARDVGNLPRHFPTSAQLGATPQTP